MKKFFAIATAAVMALSLCACGDDTNKEPEASTQGSEATNPTTQGPVGYTFTHNDVQFGVDMSAAKVVEALGKYDDRAETESCAFGGMDVDYYYPDFVINTNTEDGYERIYSIRLVSDMVETEEGVCLFQTADAVTAAYGEPSQSTDTTMVYEKDGMTLTFLLTNGEITSIQYYMG